MSYTFLIADDERPARNYLKNLITDVTPQVTILEASSADDARTILSKSHIDILFLDVKLPGEDGMQLLSSLKQRSFELIVTAACSEYAIHAIKEDAVDYLLKPLKITEFNAALDKALHRLRFPRISEVQKKREKALRQTLTIHTHSGTKFAPIKHIIYIQADNTYTNLHMANGEKITTTRPIIKLEDTLDKMLFFRIHKSYIINISHFTALASGNGGAVHMDNGVRLPVSRYRLKAFTEFISENAAM